MKRNRESIPPLIDGALTKRATQRVAGQRGNMLLYAVLFVVAWFLFFTLRSCVLEAKEKRDGPQHSHQQDDEE